MSEKTLFVESLVQVNDEKSYEVATNIIEILDGESLETLQEIEKLLNYFLKAKANEDTIHRSLSSILFSNDEKNDSEESTNNITDENEPKKITREEKIKYCRESSEFFRDKQDVNFESLNDRELLGFVGWFDYLWDK